jgi:hypothetical protein
MQSGSAIGPDAVICFAIFASLQFAPDATTSTDDRSSWPGSQSAPPPSRRSLLLLGRYVRFDQIQELSIHRPPYIRVAAHAPRVRWRLGMAAGRHQSARGTPLDHPQFGFRMLRARAKTCWHDSNQRTVARADHRTCARRPRFCRNADAVSGKQRGRPLETAVPLTDEAIAILQGVPRVKRGTYVFSTTGGETAVMWRAHRAVVCGEPCPNRRAG